MTLRDIRAGAGALLLFFATVCFELVSSGNHKSVTYTVWFALLATSLVVLLVTTALIARRPAGQPVRTATFRNGELGGDSKLRVRSTADYLADGTKIGGRVRLDADHNPIRRSR